ncbi:outer membrane protein assembly factor BamD [Emcibacteraceae bacterium]|jgi:outer membrane protein assembly factor BamD|nr:outer membrane protein assembly factor BamD [Emcibacteraceae bacterium]
MKMALSVYNILKGCGSFRVLTTLLSLFIVSACGSTKLAYKDLPVDQLYIEAQKSLDRGEYLMSAISFDQVERQHPYSLWAKRAQLMSAHSFYMANDYESSILSAERFLSLHPANENAPFARYLVALCYYEQIADVRRDQNYTESALDAFRQIVRLYPESEYAADARVKINLTLDHLAGKEMEIGRFYQTAGEFFAAIGRYNNVVGDYQTTSHTPEALHRLTEAYLALGIVMEAKKSAKVLALNFPNTDWNKFSAELLNQHAN